jgi:predicted phage terminase large subunit-like protein
MIVRKQSSLNPTGTQKATCNVLSNQTVRKDQILLDQLRLLRRLAAALKRLLYLRRICAKQYNWPQIARPSQQVPAGHWRVWLIMAGRGFGKTRTGAETIRHWIKTGTAKRIALIGASESEVRDVMIEGVSGLLQIHPDHERPHFEPSKRRLTWPNGAVATIFSAENTEQLRGPQFDCAWVDELAKFRKAQTIWDQLNFALRLGPQPRIIVTTTPKPIPLIKELLEEAQQHKVIVTRGTTFENRANLSSSFMDHLKKKYMGTTLGQQEIEGALLESIEGALWTPALLSRTQLSIQKVPDLTRIVVAVDPAVTSHHASDETGIIVAGIDQDRKAYILQDYSHKYTPAQWAHKAIAAYYQHKADAIVAEVNQGGDLVESIIRSIDPNVAFRGVHATRGKALRAEPVMALYEQGRVKHVTTAGLTLLEEQMCTYVPGITPKSPDRLDALVWAVTELLLLNTPIPQPRIYGV